MGGASREPPTWGQVTHGCTQAHRRAEPGRAHAWRAFCLLLFIHCWIFFSFKFPSARREAQCACVCFALAVGLMAAAAVVLRAAATDQRTRGSKKKKPVNCLPPLQRKGELCVVTETVDSVPFHSDG